MVASAAIPVSAAAATHLLFPSSVPTRNCLSLPRRRGFSPIKASIEAPPSAPAPALPPQIRVDILTESIPFIQRFRGKTVVVKYGGAAMDSGALQRSFIADVILLSCVGLRVVLVHGGGPEINNWIRRMGREPEFRDGLRVTDAETMEIVEMVLAGKINKSLVSEINRAGGTGVGLCGKDARLITARPSADSAVLGFVGDVELVDPSVLRPILADGHIPVIASVAADESGQGYNVNADTAAGELAAAVGAEKLILITDVAGILEDRAKPKSLVKEINVGGIRKMLEEGKVGGGMIPKVKCCMRAIDQGVKTTSIIDGRVPHSLLLEILTEDGTGTMIKG